MRLALVLMSLAALAGGGCESSGAKSSMHSASPQAHILVQPQQIDWKPGPAGLVAGSKFVLLEGDPAKAGFFTMRLLLPDGFRVTPHYHPGVERVTVLSGTCAWAKAIGSMNRRRRRPSRVLTRRCRRGCGTLRGARGRR